MARFFVLVGYFLLVVSIAQAEDFLDSGYTKQEVIGHLATALAEIEIAEKECKDFSYSKKKLGEFLKKAGKTKAELRKTEDYLEQVEAVEGAFLYAKQSTSGMSACGFIGSSHDDWITSELF